MSKKSSPRLGATAKIEASARASYSRKKTTTEIIPPDVTRAKTGAWLDLISPLTEWAGLKGDQLRYQRAQLRLQREDVLADIIKRAHQKLGRAYVQSRPIQNKFIVPFLEQASLESPDSFLTDIWASLLASAAKEFSSYHIHFVSVISQLSPLQGQIFEKLLGTKSAKDLELANDNLWMNFSINAIRRTVARLVADLPVASTESFFESIVELFNHVGTEVVHAAAEELDTHDYFEIPIPSNYRDENEVDYSILEAVGLIRRVETDFFDVGNWALTLTYYYLTPLGYHFARACGLVHEDNAK